MVVEEVEQHVVDDEVGGAGVADAREGEFQLERRDEGLAAEKGAAPDAMAGAGVLGYIVKPSAAAFGAGDAPPGARHTGATT